MKLLPILAGLALPLAALAAEPPASPDAELDRLIDAPGSWNQMCMLPRPIDPLVPLPMYRLVAERQFYLDQKNTAWLREHRKEMVPVVVKRIEALDFTKPPVLPKRE